ncbi:MAG: signal peptidase II [Endomicrobium sp.]|jgi:signal peptidase II|nr:signal peptidase II [Endomicrobium sp.]
MKAPLLFAVFIFILDQFAKFLVDKFVVYNSYINIIPQFDFFNIANIHNTGTAFGMLKDRNSLFSLIIFLLLTVTIVWFYKNTVKIPKIQRYAFCLIISGGFGNLSDRLFRGTVIDFLDFGINSLRWPAFNIADFCIFTAVFLILINAVFSSYPKPNSKV